MKRYAMAVALAISLALSMTACAAPTAQSTPETITVNGVGEITAAPDMATLELAVESRGATSEEVRSKNAKDTNATIEMLKSLGIAEDKIQTTDLSLRSNYDYNGNESGYRMTTRLQVVVQDVSRVGEIVDQVISTGINRLYGVEFGISDESALYGQALESAVAAARSSAEHLAAAGERSVGRMIGVTEQNTHMTVQESFRPNPATGGGDFAADSGTAVMGGTCSISAQIQVIFELK